MNPCYIGIYKTSCQYNMGTALEHWGTTLLLDFDVTTASYLHNKKNDSKLIALLCPQVVAFIYVNKNNQEA